MYNDVSPDAPPIDFSFKNIRELKELKAMIPRSGTRKQPPAEEEEPKEETK